MKRNVHKTIEQFRGKINPYYDASVKELSSIALNSACSLDAVCDAFVFGYAQGCKATIKEYKDNGNSYFKRSKI